MHPKPKLDAQLTDADRQLLEAVIQLDKMLVVGANKEDQLKRELQWIEGASEQLRRTRDSFVREVSESGLMGNYNELRFAHGLVRGL